MKTYFKNDRYDLSLIVADANFLVKEGLNRSMAFKTVWRVARKQKMNHLAAKLDISQFKIVENLDFRAMTRFLYREFNFNVKIESGFGIIRDKSGRIFGFVRMGHRAMKTSNDRFMVYPKQMNTFKIHHKNEVYDFIDVINKVKNDEPVFA